VKINWPNGDIFTTHCWPKYRMGSVAAIGTAHFVSYRMQHHQSSITSINRQQNSNIKDVGP